MSFFSVPDWDFQAPTVQSTERSQGKKKRKTPSGTNEIKSKPKLKQPNEKEILPTKRLKTQKQKIINLNTSETKINNSQETPALSKSAKKPVSKLSKLEKNLNAGRFRWINEKLYTTKSGSAFDLFQESPSLFDIYHEGFSTQVKKWPLNPLDAIIAHFKRFKNLKIADMGCGEAKFAQTLHTIHEIHSFDLVAANEFITACDISKTPLKDESVDAVIFSLSLMGVNYASFIKEAMRILHSKGELVIAEVTSRFENEEKFLVWLKSLGFLLVQREENKMFKLFFFRKEENVPYRDPPFTLLKPCIYKKR
ncbi:ribosomal RNA-processing protein 8 [Rozella allomycis CSF55]|nr:ribosomal RNA-processing protein 8 [Rozella allomycis CSF55]